MPLPLYSYRQYSKNFDIYYYFVLATFVFYLVICLRFFWRLFIVKSLFTLILEFVLLVISSVIFYIFVSFLVKKVEDNDNSWGRGFEAEELVGTKLAALGNEYLVIHDVLKDKEKGNIDHIVVGPTGVFVIETKANYGWLVDFCGSKQHFTDLADKFMRQVAGNALWIHNLIRKELYLDGFIQGLVIRPFNKDFKVKSNSSNNVWILDGNTAYDLIKNSPGHMSKKHVEQVYKLLCQINRENKKK